MSNQKLNYYNREKQARIEVGKTEISKRLSWSLIVLFLAIILLVPISQLTYELIKGNKIQELDIVKSIISLCQSDNKNVLSVNKKLLSDIKAFETTLEENSFLQKTLLSPIQEMFIDEFGVGNEKVYLGKDGWLFYRNDVDYLCSKGFLAPELLINKQQEKDIQPDARIAIMDFYKQLKKNNIELILMPVPNKTMVYPDKLSSSFSADNTLLQNSSYSQFIEELKKSGIFVFDISKLFMTEKSGNKDIFLKTDTHWTPEMMQKIAASLSKEIKSKIDFKADTTVYNKRLKKVSAHGDIAKMLKLKQTDKLFSRQTVSIQQIYHKDKTWQVDKNSKVLLLGDSYTNIYSEENLGWGTSAGLAEQLSYELKFGIDRISRNGSAAYTTRETLANEMQRGNNRLKNKKVVIWEFAVRELVEGNWKIIPINFKEKSNSNFISVHTGDTLSVKGRIKNISAVPRPGSVPYKDHVLSILLNIKNTNKKALVYMLSMSNNILTEISKYKEGDEIELNLLNWTDVQQKYGSYNRSETNDENYAFEEPCWGELLHSKKQSSKTVNLKTDTTFVHKQKNKKKNEIDKSSLNQNAKLLRTVCLQLLNSTENLTIKGLDNWLFHREDLKQLTYNKFWGDSAVNISKSRNPKYADPLSALSAYSKECKKNNIRLIVVPIPTKVSLYPDLLNEKTIGLIPNKELSPFTNKFYKVLQQNGVEILDIRDLFIDARKNGIQLFCKQDSHFSPDGASIVANEISKIIKTESWYSNIPKFEYYDKKVEISINGDLTQTPDENQKFTEKLILQTIKDKNGNFVNKNINSPLLLLADSHGLVFHEGGDMFSLGSGLFDLLSLDLKFPINMIAIKGSAGRTARISLYRELQQNPQQLSDIKVIVYCFTAREFTNGNWGIVPLKK